MVLFLMTGFMSVEMKIQSIPKPYFKAILGRLHLLSANPRQHSHSGPLAAVILPIFASGVMAYLVWAGGAASAVFLFMSVLLCGLFGLVAGRKATKGVTLAPTDTQTEMRASTRLALRLYVGRSCAIAALFLLLAMLVCLAFPGRIGWAAIDAAILALAFLLLIEAVRAPALQGWFLDTALPYQLLQDRLAQATAAERFHICWTTAGRCHGLRQAAALHLEAPAETNALLRAQYAPAAVFVRPPFRRKTVMEELRLRILGWRMAGLTAVAGAAVALLLILLLPSDMLTRLQVLGDVLGLTVEQPAPLPEQQKPDQPSPPQDPAAGADGSTGQSDEGNDPSEAGSSGPDRQGGEKSGGQGQAGQDAAESNPGSNKGEGTDAGSAASSKADGAGATQAGSGESNDGTADSGVTGEKPGAGADGSAPSGVGVADANPDAAPSDAGDGTGKGAAAADQPDDAGQAGAAPQGGSPGSVAVSDPTDETDQSPPADSAEAAAKDAGSAQSSAPKDATAAEGQEDDSANPGKPDADGTGQPGTAEQPDPGTAAPAPPSDGPSDSGSGTVEAAGSDQPAALADGTTPSEEPGTGQDAEASGGGKDEPASSENTGSGQDVAHSGKGADGTASGDITPGDSIGGDITPLNQPPDPNLPMVLTDEPLDGAGEGQSPSSTDANEPIGDLTLDLAERIGATAPEVGGKLELQAGGASQLFAEAGEVPEAVLARLPPQNDASPPIAAAPLPAQQLLPAWISELVN
jgi:hypothetical protein